MFKAIRKTALSSALVAGFIGAASGIASAPAQAATLLEVPSSTVSSGWFSPQTFNFNFSVSQAFENLSLFLTDGSERANVPVLGSVPLLGGLFSSATLTGNGVDQTLGGQGGTQSLAFGDYVNTFSGLIGPGDYSMQLTFLRAPLVPTDFQGSLTATAVVPEPAEWMMMLGGLGLVAFAARRRAKSSPSSAPRMLAA